MAYLVEDGNKRSAGNPHWQTHPTEPIPWRWSLYRHLSPWSNNVEKLRYAFEQNVNSNTKNIFNSVKDHYQTQLSTPWLKFNNSPSAVAQADIVISVGFEYCGGIFVPACLGSSSLVKDNIRKASYRNDLRMELNLHFLADPDNFPNYATWNNDSIKAVIAHELGHVFGLHEQYLSSGCSPVISIMDAGEVNNGVLEHCDNITLPTNSDLGQIRNYFTTSSLNYYIKDDIDASGGQIRHDWIDNSWSESLAYFWIYEYTGSPPTWQQGVPDMNSGNDIGMRHTTVFRELDFYVNPSNHGIPTGRWVIICGYPLFGHHWYWTVPHDPNNPATSVWYTGAWRCSDAEWW